ncbi:MAG: bifunctional (p)ppGpp synthetase/guanosine-3',5'-bis(diphosphate) 3'-pyrophosphohydrolase [Eubacteriaceae bacterium]|nr:bifunctional (p)ppGpp synthetase/guanosine-3',5'-bis(diphosphate) 3'-pyrophosphohydrolase [Eubacteriaceae bacterium]
MHGISDIIDIVLSNNETADIDLIARAYQYADNAHKGQKRLTGEPYIIHPLEIALILAELQMDEVTIAASLLHDVIEDTDYGYQDICDNFGPVVAGLVEGVTKISKLSYSNLEEAQSDTFRKMFVAMAEDYRVVLIKLADRLHNMRTLYAMPKEKQIVKSDETLDIYAPLAHHLGMYQMKMEFEDLALKYKDPHASSSLAEAVDNKLSELGEYLSNIMSVIGAKLSAAGINADITGRTKHLYSIYNKMKSGRSFDEIYDLTGIRIIVDSLSDCYAVLGYVHELWMPIPGRIKDYIAMRKQNGYQSLHTTVLIPGATPVEIQIRTWEMHYVAEFGVAAHYSYKEGKGSGDELASKLLEMIKDFVEDDTDDAVGFIDSVKTDLNPNNVYVLTPKGKPIELPAGATPVDFAYRIHTDVGNLCSGAKVNYKIVPLNYKLSNGDIVEILTNPNSKGPSRDWLSFVSSVSAKNKIRSFFRKADRKENIAKGKSLLEAEAKAHGLELGAFTKNEYLDYITKRFSTSTWDELYNSIGYGGITAQLVASRLREYYKADFAKINISEGKAAFEREARAYGVTGSAFITPECLDFIRQRFGAATWDELYALIGCGSLYASNAIARIIENFRDSYSRLGFEGKRVLDGRESSIQVEGYSDLAYKLAPCCNPVPGDNVVGYITRGRGISIHRADCVNITNNIEPERVISVEWANDAQGSFAAEIYVKAVDRPRLLSDVSTLIGNEGINISGSSVRTMKNQSVQMSFDVMVHSSNQLDKLIGKISEVESVLSAYRI